MAQSCVKDGTLKDAQYIQASVREQYVKEQSDPRAHQRKFERLIGRQQHPGHELHHVFPREKRYRFHDAFVELGIDINHPENLMEIPNFVSDHVSQKIRQWREEVKQGRMNETELRRLIYLEAKRDRAIHQNFFHAPEEKGGKDWNERWCNFWEQHDFWDNTTGTVDVEKISTLNRIERKQLRRDIHNFADRLIEEAEKEIDMGGFKLSEFRGKAPY